MELNGIYDILLEDDTPKKRDVSSLPKAQTRKNPLKSMGSNALSNSPILPHFGAVFCTLGRTEAKFRVFRLKLLLIFWIPPAVDQKHKVVIQMKEKKQFAALRKQYPETMNKDEFCRAAHISKLTALYLLQSGLVPCKDSGKQTRRYTIKTSDVIDYLKDRELNPEKYKACDGWYVSTPDKCEKLQLTATQTKRLEAFFKRKMERYDDLLTVKDLSSFCGYCTKVIYQWCSNGNLQFFQIAKRYLIPKDYAAKRLASPAIPL